MADPKGSVQGLLGSLRKKWTGLSAPLRKQYESIPMKHMPLAIVILLTLSYILVFTATTFAEHNRRWYGNFDLGIPDQGIWLLSQFKDPYLTTRGLNLFGDHASYIHIFIAPLYWLWDDVKALLFLHTVALASGAIPLYLLAREKLKSDWAPVILCFSYLLLPALHFSNLDQGYHFESFAVPLLLWAHYFVVQKRYASYSLAIFLTMMCKEDLAFTLIPYGIYVAFKYNRRIGAATSVFAITWLLIVMNVLFPFFNGEGAFYASRTLGSFGDTPMDKLRSATNIDFMAKKIITRENEVYVRKLLEPVGYLVLLDPASFLCAGSLWVTLVQDWPYAHQIQYHYVTPIIPVIYISLVEGLSRLKKHKTWTGIVLGILLVQALHGNYNYSPDQSTLRDPMRPIGEIQRFDEVSEDMQKLLDIEKTIPRTASVTASYNLVPHLAHREKIYMFPNPYKRSYYGIDDRGVPPDNETEYVYLDIGLVGNDDKWVFDKIKSGGYVLESKHNQFELWRRIDA